MIKVYAKRGENIFLGRKKTYGVRQVIFDFTMWVDMFGLGNIQLIVKRPEDVSPYIAPLSVSGDKAIWEIAEADTARSGEGECELQYYVNGSLEKSQIYTTYIANAMDTPGEAPEDPAKGYYDKVIDAAIRVENAVVKAPIIFAGTWWTWDFDKGEYVDTGVNASGGITDGGGGSFPELDDTLKIDPTTRKLGVNMATEVADLTLPITAAAVNTTVGNIEVLLQTI